MRLTWHNLNLDEFASGPSKSAFWWGRCFLWLDDGCEAANLAWKVGGLRLGARLGLRRNSWIVEFHVPLLSLYFGIVGRFLPGPAETRSVDLNVRDWGLSFALWERDFEWRSSDPWWVRGVRFDPLDIVLGRYNGSRETLETIEVEIPMPEGMYPAKVVLERWTRGRPRWFKKVTLEWGVDIPGGIPFPGKGENSWDCGTDGLFGCGALSQNGKDVEVAIAKAVEIVLQNRRRYGGRVSWAPEAAAGAR